MACAAEHADLLIERMGNNPLQILIAIQKAFNHVSDDAICRVASALGIPLSRILGDVEFYSFLSREPLGTYSVLMSDSITDWMLGSRELFLRLCGNLGVSPRVMRHDGLATVGKTSCTGMCDQGPAMLVNGTAVANLSDDRIDAISRLMEKRIPLAAWPGEYFHVESNIRRRDWLFQDWRGPILEGEALLQEMTDAGLRGRGGAGYPTAKKWASCRDAPGGERHVVCNADEGEPGTFKDRVLLQHCAGRLFEGMALCARIIKAKKGFLYVRGEYRYLEAHLEALLAARRDADFEIELHWGAGAYICGEESALLESIEGKRGIPRVRPPFPVIFGVHGMPTVVDNVETFCAAAAIAAGGGREFRSLGTAESCGTKLLSVSGDCARPGIYEYSFGVSVDRILEDCGAGNVLAVQVGGAAGNCLDASEFGRKICFEDLPTSGSVMVFDRSRDMREAALNFSRFFAHESCGFCTPCRVGTEILAQAMEGISAGRGSGEDIAEIGNLGSILRASHCGLGQSANRAVLDMLRKFPEHFERGVN